LTCKIIAYWSKSTLRETQKVTTIDQDYNSFQKLSQ